jgi:protein O-GlcNAc transferase
VYALAALLLFLAAAQDPAELYRAGTQRFAARDFGGAIVALERSVALKPDYAEAWKALGVVHAAQGDYEASEKPFRNACELAPALPDACHYYGRTLYLLNRFQPALNVLRNALKTDPENAQVHRLIALCLEALGDVSAAGAEFQTAIRLDRGSPPNSDPAIDYGVYLYRQGRSAEALGPLERALVRHPDSARANLELGCVLLALDRLSDAEKRLERAIALDPQSSRAHLLLGKVYQRLGKTEAAAEQLRHATPTK